MKSTSTNMILEFSFLYLFGTALAQLRAQSKEINVIMIILGEHPNSGFFSNAPMYDVALQRVAAHYPELSAYLNVTVLYQPGVADCAEAGGTMNSVAGKMFDLVINKKNSLTALFSPGNSVINKGELHQSIKFIK
jgi:hypothetical protein